MKARKKPRAQSLRRRTKKALRSIWRAVSALPWWADVLTVAAFLWGVYEYRHVLVPQIRPDAAISTAWLDLPITAHNPGDHFTMRDVHFFCEVTNVTWKSDKAATGFENIRAIGPIEHTVPSVFAIAPDSTVTFPCDIANSIKAQYYPNGAQLPVALIHMHIRATYTLDFGIFNWHRETTSQLFTWRAVSGGFQWLEGDTSDKVK